MARNLTTLQLVDRARVLADAENREHISLANWKEFLSVAWGELATMLSDAGLRYFESEDTITTDGNASYALPSDFDRSLGVDYEVSSTTGERRALSSMMLQQRNYGSATSGQTASGYAIVGQNVRLYPTPPSGQTYYHVYIPQPADISANADGTNVDVVNSHGEAYVINAMAAVALAKEEADASFVISQREKAEANFNVWAANRLMESSRRPQVEGDYYDRFGEDAGDYRDRGGGGGWW